MLSKSCQESQSIKNSRALVEKTQKLKLSKRSQDIEVAKRVQDQNFQEIQIAKMSKLPKVLDVKNPRAPPRDTKVQGILVIHVTKRAKYPKSFPEKSMLPEAKLFLVIAFTCIVKGPLLELMSPML